MLPAAERGLHAGPALPAEARDRPLRRRRRRRAGSARIGFVYIAAIIGECAFFYAQYYLTMLVAQRSLADLRVQVFAHVQRLPMSYFDRNPVGRLVTRLTTDVDVLNEMFAAGAMTIFMDVLTLVGIVAIMVSIDCAPRAGVAGADAGHGARRSTSSASRRAAPTARSASASRASTPTCRRRSRG